MPTPPNHRVSDERTNVYAADLPSYKQPMNFTLYPIYWVADAVDDEPFDLSKLPFDITEGVRIEAVGERFREGTFDPWNERFGTEVVRALKEVRYALVHRYHPDPIVVDGQVIGQQQHSQRSEKLVRMLAACVRLVRPMRQHALLTSGNIRDEDDSFDVTGFDVPTLGLFEAPEVQKLFMLRNRDADALRVYGPEFLRAMRGEFWKFRMAVEFHDAGQFQSFNWKARYLLWCSAIESIYTSHDWEHQGSLVATSRIKWFIGENMSIYGPGDILKSLEDPQISVEQVISDLYEMRNLIAHGDRIPDRYFTDVLRQGINGPVRKWEVLFEAASFIIRTSLLKILRDGLLNHFADTGPAEAYFSAHGLTKSALRAAQRATAQP